jgi:hypothetical protein
MIPFKRYKKWDLFGIGCCQPSPSSWINCPTRYGWTTNAYEPGANVTEGYNQILPYTGCFSISDLPRYPWIQLNGSHQNVIHTSNLRANHATLQATNNHNQIGGLRSQFPNGNLLSSSAIGVDTSTTPASVPPEIDLTLRLGPPTPRPAAEVSTPGIYYPFQIGCNVRRVVYKGCWPKQFGESTLKF